MPIAPLRPRSHRFAPAAVLLLSVGWLAAAGCGPGRESAEEHRRLSLRIEHRPAGRAVAGEDAVIRALVQSTLDTPRIEAWVRILGEDGGDERLPLVLGPDGEAVATLPGRAKGSVVRYVIEASDAAGLLVTLPRGSADGAAYELRFEGSSPRFLGGITWLSAVLAFLFWLGAAAAAVQTLRGQMSAGPPGLLGTLGLAFAVVGLFLIGGIHTGLVTGRPWSPTPIFWALSRGDVAVVSLLWAVNLFLGRRILLDEAPDGNPGGERGFTVLAVVAGALALVLAIR